MTGVTNQVLGGRSGRLHPFRRVRRGLLAVAGAVGVLGVAAATLVSRAAAEGFAVGALAAGAALWWMAYRAEQLPGIAPNRILFVVYRGTLGRLVLYGAAFALAYALDRSRYHALIAAVIGLSVVYTILILVAALVLRPERARRTPGND